jgi:hypothetical protein
MDALPPRISLGLSLIGILLMVVGNAFQLQILDKIAQILVAAAIVGFIVHLLFLLLWQPRTQSNPDLRLSTYLRAFFSDWLTIMSGPLSVPLTALALFTPQRAYKILFGTFAVLCWIYGSFRVWREERLAGHAAHEKYASAIAEFTEQLREAVRIAELRWSQVDRPELNVTDSAVCQQIDEFLGAVEKLYSSCPAEMDSQPLRTASEKLHATRNHRMGRHIVSRDEADKVCDLMRGALADVRSMLGHAR